MPTGKQNLNPISTLLSFVIWVFWGGTVSAGETKVALAANFTAAAKEIAASFQKDTGHKAVLIFGSTGKIYTQIYSGAPFDVFLAADQERPKKAEANGLAVAGTRFTYASGKIELYSTDPTLIDAKALIDGIPTVLREGRFTKLAIANPKTAPYGAAAVSTLTKLGLYNKLFAKLVRGDNAAQTHQFVMTGNAQLGFVARSLIMRNKNGSRWPVPDYLYAPIRQDAVLLKHGAGNPAALAFLDYLKDQKARAIIKKFGYGLE